MDVIRVTDETGATYYDLAVGDHLDQRKSEVDSFDALPEKVQQAWLDTWAEQLTAQAVDGLEALAAITTYLRQNKKRSNKSEIARRQLVVKILSVPFAEAAKEQHTAGGSTKKVDLIAAVRETLGVPYATLAAWAKNVDDKAVVKEIEKRAKSPAPEGASAPG